jgi:hypothetical protein
VADAAAQMHKEPARSSLKCRRRRRWTYVVTDNCIKCKYIALRYVRWAAFFEGEIRQCLRFPSNFVFPTDYSFWNLYSLASHMGRMAFVQHALFHELPHLPGGFRYEAELLSPEEERTLMSTFERLPFRDAV